MSVGVKEGANEMGVFVPNYVLNAEIGDGDELHACSLSQYIGNLLSTPFLPNGMIHLDLAHAKQDIAVHVPCVHGVRESESFYEATEGMLRVEMVRTASTSKSVASRFCLVIPAEDASARAAIYNSASVVVSTCTCLDCADGITEAMACGAPVAALPGIGALKILGDEGRGPLGYWPMTVGVVSADLKLAVAQALKIDRLSVAARGSHLLANRSSASAVVKEISSDDLVLCLALPA